MLQGSLLSLLDLSLIVGGVILLLLLLRTVIYRKMVIKWWYGIWLVLVLRLLVPFSGEVQLNIVEMSKGLIRSDG